MAMPAAAAEPAPTPAAAAVEAAEEEATEAAATAEPAATEAEEQQQEADAEAAGASILNSSTLLFILIQRLPVSTAALVLHVLPQGQSICSISVIRTQADVQRQQPLAMHNVNNMSFGPNLGRNSSVQNAQRSSCFILIAHRRQTGDAGQDGGPGEGFKYDFPHSLYMFAFCLCRQSEDGERRGGRPGEGRGARHWFEQNPSVT